MEWWTDLWLNEGFASYTEYIGTDHVDPESAILGTADSLGTKTLYWNTEGYDLHQTKALSVLQFFYKI